MVAGPVAMVGAQRNGAKIAAELSVMPIRALDGRVSGLALDVRDIAERKAADAQRTLLLRELSHRVKNALATVQAIAMQTLRTEATPEAFAAAFTARLMALAQTHDLLTRSEWQGALLRDIIEAELAPYDSEAHARWSCEGPAVRVTAKTALALGMACHELATNAAKYGAFSNPNGRVEVTWSRQSGKPDAQLHMVWAEVGGPPVRSPERKGFGTRLISDGLALELNAEVALEFLPTGVRCTVDLTLTDSNDGP